MHTGMLWKSMPCSRAELRLDITLACGQSFRWREASAGEWIGVLVGRVWTLAQTEDTLLYHVDSPSTAYSKPAHLLKQEMDQSESPVTSQHKMASSDLTDTKPMVKHEIDPTPCLESENILKDYFQLSVDLSKLYTRWNRDDSNFKSKASDFTGVRILRQHPIENLFSFICSSNNNISRISLMVERMCEKYGDKVADIDGVSYHSFPTIEALTGDTVEQSLRDMGFGYRAKYISQTARYISEHGGIPWLYGLRGKSYEDAKSDLMKLSGVGAKVADCVCLMSLDKHGAIPVDTHVWQIVTRDYKHAGITANKTITERVYNEIGDFFRELWGSHAGWAQSVLFSADLKKFQSPKESPTKKRKSSLGTTEVDQKLSLKKEKLKKTRQK